MQVFCSNFKKPNKWLIDIDIDSNYNRLPDTHGAPTSSTLDGDEKKSGEQFEWKIFVILLFSSSSHCSLFKFSLYIIHEKNMFRLKSLFCLIT